LLSRYQLYQIFTYADTDDLLIDVRTRGKLTLLKDSLSLGLESYGQDLVQRDFPLQNLAVCTSL